MCIFLSLFRWFLQSATVYSLIIMVELLYCAMLLSLQVFQIDLVNFHREIESVLRNGEFSLLLLFLKELEGNDFILFSRL